MEIKTGPDRDRTLMTPGPWEMWLSPLDGVWHITHKIPNNRIIVGFIGDEGNAKVVAASPDLLAALENILNRHAEDDFIPIEYWNDAKRAIAKATQP